MGKLDSKGEGRAAADPRFAAMHSDPRFQRFPKQKNKILVDKRFAGMFEDPEFHTRSVVDKRGLKIEPRRRNEDLRRYYRLRDEDEWRDEKEGTAEDKEAVAATVQGQAKKAAGTPATLEKAPARGQEVAKRREGASGEERVLPQLKAKKDREGPPKQQQQQQQQQQELADLKGPEPGAASVAAQAAKKKKTRKKAAVATLTAPHQQQNLKPGNLRKGQGLAEGKAASRASEAAGWRVPSPSDEEDAEEVEVEDDDQKDQVRGLAGFSGSGDDDQDDREDEEEEEEEEEEERRAKERWARARGMLVSDSSSDDDAGEGEDDEEYDSADEPLTDEDDEQEEQLDPAEWGAGANALNPEEQIPEQEETRRLAMVDLDWDHVRAVDILVALRSFLPRGSAVERVTVYPSDFGLQRMAEEAALGPTLILKPAKLGAGAAEGAAGAGKQKPRKPAPGHDDGDGSEVDTRRLAAYEKSRLRYYYAIVECDCIATALHLYNECDGMEFERSASKFDMRFVPDEQSFEGRQVRDTATDVPAGYEPPATFNISLQHTDPKLSWDAEDPERKRKLHGRRLKTDEELLEADFAAYLGSEEDDDDDDAEVVAEEEAGPDLAAAGPGEARPGPRPRTYGEDAEAIRQRYRALLLGGGDTRGGDDTGAKTKGRVGGKSWLPSEDGEEEEKDQNGQEQGRGGRGGGHRDQSTSGTAAAAAQGRRGGTAVTGKGDVDMVVTFHSGLEGLGERIKRKKEEERARAGETVWEAYLRKKREKRALRRAQGRLRNLSDSEDSEDYISDGDDGDAGVKGKEKGQAKAKDGNKAGKGKGRSVSDDGDDDDDGMYGNVVPDDPFFQQGDGDDPFADPFFNQDDVVAAAGGRGRGCDSDSDSDDDDDDNKASRGRHKAQGPSGRGGSKDKKDSKNGSQAAAERADLELLLMDDAALRDAARGIKTRVLAAGHDGPDLVAGKRKLTKKEKRELKKEAKRQARAGSDEDDAAGGGEEAALCFEVNLADPRFADMFHSADFALDPTDPRYKKMQAREKVLTEVQRRRSQQPQHDGLEQQQNVPACAATEGRGAASEERQQAGGDLRVMVAKLKRKAETQQEKQRAEALGKGQKKSRL